MRILVIEDEERIARYLHKGLSECGHVVDMAGNGVDGLHLGSEGQYELVILDLTLPGLDGLEVLRRLRARSDIPIMLLTARDTVEDKVRGLTEGADDYLVKPFSFSELAARVQALSRRGTPARSPYNATSVLRMGTLVVDLARHRATREGVELFLTPKEFQLLTLLLQRRGQVLSRTMLAEVIWDVNFNSDTNVIDVAVRRLRSKLDDPFESRLLHTVRGVGYTLEERED